MRYIGKAGGGFNRYRRGDRVIVVCFFRGGERKGMDNKTSPSAVKASVGARPGRRGGESASSAIYRKLKEDIVAMRLRPGAPVVEKLIAQRFGVSRTPVREAVLKLAGEGLVDVFPQSGTFVSRIPLDDLPEVVVIRSALEQAAAGHAARRAEPDDIDALRANVAAQRAVSPDDHEGFHLLDEAFHAMIADVAGYPGFWRLTRQVKVQLDRCRRLIMPQPGRRAEALDEHEAVVNAIAAHQPEAASQAMAAHLERVLNLVCRAQASTPEHFTPSRRGETLVVKKG